MEYTKFNFGAVLAIIVLLGFSYITFMGLVYHSGGSLQTPVILTCVFIAVVITCILIMCKSRATRWKSIGTAGQILFGAIILGAFLAGTIPFTNFLRVAASADEFRELVDETGKAASQLDEAYTDYVSKRVREYKDNLEASAYNDSTADNSYRRAIGNAVGRTPQERISRLSSSLANRLQPDSTATIVAARHKWLDESKNASIWNPATPENFNKIQSTVESWLTNYRELSKTHYVGDTKADFEYKDFDTSLKKLTDSYSEFRKPSFLAILIAVLCFGVMLLPYFLTEKDLAGASDAVRRKAMRQTSTGNVFNKRNEN